MPSECFDNTEKHVAQNGGSVQHGRIIWEAPGKLLDAEFHAVWRDPNGNLVDITPKVDGETRILFLPDDTRVWENKPVPNIRHQLDNSPETKRMINRANALYKIKKKHFKSGKIDQKAAEQKLFSYLESLKKAKRNDSCPCGSGKKLKKCCGQNS